MADIAMCGNSETCPVKDNCYRHTAPVNPYRQSYSAFNKEDGSSCDNFWENRKWDTKESQESQQKASKES